MFFTFFNCGNSWGGLEREYDEMRGEERHGSPRNQENLKKRRRIRNGGFWNRNQLLKPTKMDPMA